MPNYHISIDKEHGWKAAKENSLRVSAYADTQKEAEDLAKQFAGNAGGGEVRIHGRDGKIRDSDTVAPGNDPCPPKDTKF
jgi:Uncharacterized protein conserved in bacteria (DUF2188)